MLLALNLLLTTTLTIVLAFFQRNNLSSRSQTNPSSWKWNHRNVKWPVELLPTSVWPRPSSPWRPWNHRLRNWVFGIWTKCAPTGRSKGDLASSVSKRVASWCSGLRHRMELRSKMRSMSRLELIRSLQGVGLHQVPNGWFWIMPPLPLSHSPSHSPRHFPHSLIARASQFSPPSPPPLKKSYQQITSNFKGIQINNRQKKLGLTAKN